MSIIRQRSKNLIFSGLIGFISALLIVLIVYVFGIRGNIKVIEWILNDSQLEVMTMSEPIEEPITKTKQVVRLKEKVLKDAVISEEMLEIVDVEASNIPENVCLDTGQLLGKKALIDLETLTMMTDSMTESVNVYEVSFETLEIQNVHYPDILSIGQSINMRIHYPTGQDYTILENKNVIHIDPENKSFFVNLSEEEILSYSSAKEDKNIYPGTELYITIEGSGNIRLEDSSKEIVSAYKEGLNYDSYPLNPNVLALSQVKNFDTVLLDERVTLDISLKEFFDLNSERFSYEIELNERQGEGQEELGEDESKADVGLNTQEESDTNVGLNNQEESNTNVGLNTGEGSNAELALDIEDEGLALQALPSESELDVESEADESVNEQGDFDF